MEAEKLDIEAKAKPLFEGSDWTFDKLRRVYDAVEEVALEDLGLNVYPNQVEIISSEQMLDAYSSFGMPLMYKHWSFGKQYIRDEALYRKGFNGLAYEIVINSNPCISYNMEENSMAIQTLVIAHAAFGHNHFFKNNYLFRQWTDADGILEYLEFAKSYIAKCEERHGIEAVEDILDSAHALKNHGVSRYRRPAKLNMKELAARERSKQEYKDSTFNDLWRTVPKTAAPADKSAAEQEASERRKALKLPEENLLYFLEKNSTALKTWQREILRIIRNIDQYVYPQKQTKIMNEGCATFVHQYITNKLYDDGLIPEGAMLEILHSHSNVVFQPDFNDKRYRGINPYALGFEMMQDIKRICMEPTDEDRAWFPEMAGSGDWRAALKDAWANYRDESFIQQFLSPNLIRKLRLFVLTDDQNDPHLTVDSIHDELGYKKVRTALARNFDLAANEPDIQIVDVDLRGDRLLQLRHVMRDGAPLREKSREQVLLHLKRLWGYDVELTGIDGETEKEAYRASTAQQENSVDKQNEAVPA